MSLKLHPMKYSPSQNIPSLPKKQNLDGYRRQMQSHRNGIQMSTCSKWKRTMVESPSRDMKEHNGTTPDTHTLIQQNKWLRGTDAQIMQTCDAVHNKSKHVPCLALRSVSTFQCILSAHILQKQIRNSAIFRSQLQPRSKVTVSLQQYKLFVHPMSNTDPPGCQRSSFFFSFRISN